jgi:hypothetical protein
MALVAPTRLPKPGANGGNGNGLPPGAIVIDASLPTIKHAEPIVAGCRQVREAGLHSEDTWRGMLSDRPDLTVAKLDTLERQQGIVGTTSVCKAGALRGKEPTRLHHQDGPSRMVHLHRVMCETALLHADFEATHAAESHIQVMIANAAGLFFVTEDRAVVGPLDYWAFGSGRDFALGALKVGASSKEAVLAAAHFNMATEHHLIERSFEYGGDYTCSEDTLKARRETKLN